jgi:monoamine oxidase
MSEERCHVVIIGGGVAGLAAAGELAAAGLDIILLEARDRLGGRILSERRRGWGSPIELGAEFLHDGNAAFWRLLRRNRLRPRRVPPRHWRFNGAGLERVDDLAGRIQDVTKRIDIERMRGWTFADFLRFKAHTLASLDRELASAFVEGFEAAPLDRMSAVALGGETLRDDRQFVLPEGYDRVVAALRNSRAARRVRVYDRTVVTSIEWQRGAVTVLAGARSFCGAAAVVALPLGVLQAQPPGRGAVRFDPALNEKQAVIARMHMGHVIRVTLRFEPRGWGGIVPADLCDAGSGGFGFIHSRLDGVPVWWALNNLPVVTGWAGGPNALKLASASDAGIRDQALLSLGRIFNRPKAALHAAIADWATHNWSRDPFSRGAYSFVGAGRDESAAQLRIPVEDTLFFAGEATAGPGETGTVHGALASGLRAAAEVRRVLRVTSRRAARVRSRR